MPRNDEDEISDEQAGGAIEDTNTEVFLSAFQDDPDLDGKGTDSQALDYNELAEMQDIHGNAIGDDGELKDEEQEDEEAEAEPDEDEEEADEEDEPEDEAEEDDQDDRRNGQQLREEREFRRVPASRLTEEAERRRQAERDNQELRERIARLEGAQQRQQQPQQQEQRPQEFPDPVLDPDGFRRAVQNDALRQARSAIEQDRMTRVNAALNEAAQGENGWKIRAAIDHISSTLDPRNPEHARIVQGLVYSSDPVGSLISHWEKNGGRDQEDAMFRRLAEERGYRLPETARRQSQPQRRVAREDESPRNFTRIPKSLNSAGGHGRRVQTEDPDLYDESEQSIFEYAFK